MRTARALEAIASFHQELVEHYIEDYYYSEDPKVKASAIFAMGLNCQSPLAEISHQTKCRVRRAEIQV